MCTSIIFFWPFQLPVHVGGTGDNMNYTIVVVGATLILSGVYWVQFARFYYKGPLARAAAVEAAKAAAMASGGSVPMSSVELVSPSSLTFKANSVVEVGTPTPATPTGATETTALTSNRRF